jgi:hypothetical protein
MRRVTALMAAGAALLALAACNQAKNAAASAENTAAAAGTKVADAAADVTGGAKMLKADATDQDRIDSAMSAAPKAVAEGATIMMMNADGTMKELRKGTGNFTCIPDDVTTPGPDPMCFDSNAASWVDAWAHKKTPANGKVGVMYMLTGGTDASNVDPYAKGPTDANHWVKTGPHLMVVGSKELLAGYPSGAEPDTSKPYVMWAGTPYAHLMIPVK